MNKDNVLKQIEDKLLPTVKNVESGNASEHDIFPSLLWLLLENSKDLEKSAVITEAVLLERVEDLKQVSATQMETIKKSATTTEAVLLEHIGNLKQVLQEDVKTVVTQENQKTLSLLKWIIGLCTLQFIGLGVLAAIILMR